MCFEDKRPLIAVVGPTSSGKSDLGIALAQKFNGEVVNADSVQAYRYINIATGKVPIEEQQGIRHHLFDIAEPEDNLTSFEWASLARATISDIESRGKTAFLVGGAGFYLSTLASKFFVAPEIREGLRPRLHEISKRHGAEHLHRMLRRVDPVFASKHLPADRQRVMRGLEVFFSSGQRLSTLQAGTPQEPTDEGLRLQYLVLQPPRDQLYQRINETVERMVKRGLLEEIQGLIANGVSPSSKIFNALGYKSFVEHLLGQRTLDSAIEQMKIETRHLAKRQWSWWRGQKSTHWLEGFGFEDHVIDRATSLTNSFYESSVLTEST